MQSVLFDIKDYVVSQWNPLSLLTLFIWSTYAGTDAQMNTVQTKIVFVNRLQFTNLYDIKIE